MLYMYHLISFYHYVYLRSTLSNLAPALALAPDSTLHYSFQFCGSCMLLVAVSGPILFFDLINW